MPRVGRPAFCLSVLGATFAVGCNDIFDIKAGTPRTVNATPCMDPMMIDDMEDGDAKICSLLTSGGRNGGWFTIGDGTSTDLQPAPDQPFAVEPIPQGREASRYAAHMTGSRFTDWGALMGFTLNGEGFDTQPHDARGTQGVRFWMKSNAPVSVGFPMPETLTPEENAGTCVVGDGASWNCDNHFQFSIAAVKDNGTLTAANPGQWVEYDVPFTAATQPYFTFDLDGNPIRGSATWNSSRLIGVTFRVDPLRAFDVWIDDIRFISSCGAVDCLPTCPDPAAPVACPARGGAPAICWPVATDCANVLALSLNGVWGSGPRDVWAVGGQGPLDIGATAHWDGSTWSSVASGSSRVLNKVWGSGPDDVWAVGNKGTVVHWDGSGWSAVESGTNHPLLAAWGSGPNDVWAVGGAGTIIHWNRSTWSAATGGAAYTLNGVWGSSSTDVWAVGYSSTVGIVLHWDGSTWSVAPSGATLPLSDVWGTSSGNVWAVGGGGPSLGGTILHWNGLVCSAATRVTTRKLLGVWGSGPNDIWTVGGAAVVNPAGSLVGNASGAVDAAVGGAATINPVGTGTAVHGSGTAWSAALSNAALPLNGVWGSGPNDVWAVGGAGPSFGGTVLHWDGTSWSAVPIGSLP